MRTIISSAVIGTALLIAPSAGFAEVESGAMDDIPAGKTVVKDSADVDQVETGIEDLEIAHEGLTMQGIKTDDDNVQKGIPERLRHKDRAISIADDAAHAVALEAAQEAAEAAAREAAAEAADGAGGAARP